MKLKFFTLVSLLFSGAFLSAQMSGMMTMQQNSNSRGTALGANTTTGAAGIALGNRVVMRGYVDFHFKYEDGKSLWGHPKPRILNFGRCRFSFRFFSRDWRKFILIADPYRGYT